MALFQQNFAKFGTKHKIYQLHNWCTKPYRTHCIPKFAKNVLATAYDRSDCLLRMYSYAKNDTSRTVARISSLLFRDLLTDDE